MIQDLYRSLKRSLPAPIRRALSSVNQRFFARKTLQRQYGAWFDVDWRKKYATMSDEEWIRAYNEVWRNHHNDCLDETDSALVLALLRELSGGEPRNVQKILEVGCGAGRLAIAMAQTGYSVTCLDVSDKALAKAQTNAEQEGVSSIAWVHGFAEKMPFADRSFDAITCCHTLEHVKSLESAISEMKRVATKGVVVIVPKQEFRLYADNYHTQFFSRKEELIAAFGLERFRCFEVDCRDHESEFHGEALVYLVFFS